MSTHGPQLEFSRRPRSACTAATVMTAGIRLGEKSHASRLPLPAAATTVMLCAMRSATIASIAALARSVHECAATTSRAASVRDPLFVDTAAVRRTSEDLRLIMAVGDDDGSELVDLLAADVPTPEQVMLDREEERALHDLLGVLDTRARHAVEQRFGLTDGRKRSYREAGEELGVTAEAALRLVKRAVDAVREEALARASAA